MARFSSVAAIAAAALALAPSAGFAQTPRGYYTATPATAPTKASLVTRSVVWNCEAGTCAAKKSDSRDGIMCEVVVKELGKLNSFSAGGKEFDADALAKCNARAKG